jgi:hypothetical protein
MRRAVLAIGGAEAGWFEGALEDCEWRRDHRAALFGYSETSRLASAF